MRSYITVHFREKDAWGAGGAALCISLKRAPNKVARMALCPFAFLASLVLVARFRPTQLLSFSSFGIPGKCGLRRRCHFNCLIIVGGQKQSLMLQTILFPSWLFSTLSVALSLTLLIWEKFRQQCPVQSNTHSVIPWPCQAYWLDGLSNGSDHGIAGASSPMKRG